MAIVAVREKLRGGTKQAQVPYWVQETDSGLNLTLDDAIAAADAQAVADVGYTAGQLSYDQVSKNVYRIVQEYQQNNTTPLQPPDTGDARFSFAFQAKGRYRFNALEYIGAFDALGAFTIPGEPLALNVQTAGGVSRAVGQQFEPLPPVFQLEYTAANAVVTPTYIDVVSGLCGCFNNATFRGYAAGQIQLVSAVGAKRTNEDWQLAFGFGYQPNETSVDIGGGITIPELRGSWHYFVQTVQRKMTGRNVLVPHPTWAIVQRVWPEANLGGLGLPS